MTPGLTCLLLRWVVAYERRGHVNPVVVIIVMCLSSAALVAPFGGLTDAPVSLPVPTSRHYGLEERGRRRPVPPVWLGAQVD